MAAWRLSRALKLFRLLPSNAELLPRVSGGLCYEKCRGDYRSQCRALSCASSLRVTANLDGEATEKPKRKKTLEIPKITLLHPDNTMTVTDLEDAKKLAKRRNLKLVKQNEVDKSDREIYKLVTGGDFVKGEEAGEVEDKSKAKGLKSVKIFYTQSTIAKRDFLIKLKNIIKVLNKKHKVKIVIADSGGNMDALLNAIKTEIKTSENSINVVNVQNGKTIYITPSLDKGTTPSNKTETTDKPQPKNEDKNK